MSLTGRFWFRKTWTGKLVLLVEEQRPKLFGRKGSFTLGWRTAKLVDFAEPAMRPLLNLEHSMRPDHTAARPAGLRVAAQGRAEAPAPTAVAA